MPANRKSIEAHRRDGTKVRVNGDKLDPDTIPVIEAGGRVDGPPPAPSHLTDQEAAAWDQIVTSADLVLDKGDLTVVELAATSLAVARRALDELNGRNLTSESARGAPVIDSAFRVYAEAARIHMQLADRLGLNPSARARLGIDAARAQKAMREELDAVAGGRRPAVRPSPHADVEG